MSVPPEKSWLTLVGIGEDGWDGLSGAARAAVENAALVVGGTRHLAFLPPGGQERRAWPSPLAPLLDEIVSGPKRTSVILASGDPLFYGIGALVVGRLASGEYRILPQPSSASLACARLGWALQEVAIVSACGRPLECLHAELFDGARILVLSADRATPHAVSAMLAARGFADSALHVLEHLGGPRERVVASLARDWPANEIFADLNVVAIAARAGPDARILTRVAGLPDDVFAHDGQITKREIRALTLAQLCPRPGALLWDIGAGSGSIGIEWMRAAARARAIGIEMRADRAARARENAALLGVPGYRVIEGAAPAALTGLAAPDAVFVGGGLTTPGLVDAAWAALPPGGRMVANAVTLEGEAVLAGLYARWGGDLTRIAVSRADAVGGMTGWRPAMPVTQWAAEKPA